MSMSLINHPVDDHGEIQDDSGSRHVSSMQQQSKPRKRTKKTKQPTQKATVKVLATDVNTTSANTFGTSVVNDDVLARIRKCFERGEHATTPEAEAEAALRLAEKLMEKCNVTKAEVFAQQDENELAQHAGESVVAITSTKAGKRVINNGWIPWVRRAMGILFDCKSYSTRFASKIEYTFYGIVDNTAAAATAFEIVYNLILDWSMLKTDVSTKNSYCIGVAEGFRDLAKEQKREEARNASKTAAEIMAQREREELAERERQIDRLNYQETSVSEPEDDDIQDVTAYDDQREISSENSVSSGEERMPDGSETEDEVLPDFDDETEDTVDPFASLESEIHKLRQRSVTRATRELGANVTGSWSWFREEIKIEDDDHVSVEADQSVNVTGSWSCLGEETKIEDDGHVKVEADQDHKVDLFKSWGSKMQLMAFRATAEKIADDYLKAKDIKLSKRAHRASTARDYDAYWEGVKDSEKIDVRRKMLE